MWLAGTAAQLGHELVALLAKGFATRVGGLRWPGRGRRRGRCELRGVVEELQVVAVDARGDEVVRVRARRERVERLAVLAALALDLRAVLPRALVERVVALLLDLRRE